MKTALIATVALAFASLSTAPAIAETAVFKAKGSALTITGDITDESASTLVSVLADLDEHNIKLTRVILDSRGGSIDAAITMGQAITGAHIQTEVGRGGVCASACFDILMAGYRTKIDPSAKLGVHQAHDSSTGAVNVLYTERQYEWLRLRHVPQNVLDRLNKTGPNDAYWLTPSEIEQIDGAKKFPPVAEAGVTY